MSQLTLDEVRVSYADDSLERSGCREVKNIAKAVFFAFDLDGTITECEMLPRLAELLGQKEKMRCLTDQALSGEIPFAESFAKRFNMLRDIPLAKAREAIAGIPLNQDILRFIIEHRGQCAVVTGNVDVWVEPMVQILDCPFYTSNTALLDGTLHLRAVVDKAAIVSRFADQGHLVVAVGDSHNDLELFSAATVKIAYGGVNEPPASLQAAADYVIRDSADLCRLLNKLGESLVHEPQLAQERS